MPPAHRNNDNRQCTGKTVVQGQSTVFVNDRLWAVIGDVDDHQQGKLLPTTGQTVFIEDKLVIVHGPDKATPDNKGHQVGATDTGEGSGDVSAY
jgi:hypothetical protein